MENEKEYKFITAFVAGKTLAELTEEELARLKKGHMIKREDTEYLASLENKTITEIKESEIGSIELVDDVPEGKPILDTVNIVPDEVDENTVDAEPTETSDTKEAIENEEEETVEEKAPKGTKVVRAIGNKLTLADSRVITLSKDELKEKSYWRRGDIYYGEEE